jgi:hypothetical protein
VTSQNLGDNSRHAESQLSTGSDLTESDTRYQRNESFDGQAVANTQSPGEWVGNVGVGEIPSHGSLHREVEVDNFHISTRVALSPQEDDDPQSILLNYSTSGYIACGMFPMLFRSFSSADQDTRVSPRSIYCSSQQWTDFRSVSI